MGKQARGEDTDGQGRKEEKVRVCNEPGRVEDGVDDVLKQDASARCSGEGMLFSSIRPQHTLLKRRKWLTCLLYLLEL